MSMRIARAPAGQRVKVEVVNATTVRGLARRATRALRDRGYDVVAVGTTTVRTLESWAAFGQAEGDTQIFITPGFRFQVIDALITNFHLPKSTLMMLVSAFAGLDTMRAAYAHAIRAGYLFYSYGDASLLLPDPAGV